MLKTPRFPIWVTKLNGTFGLLFSTNPDLVSDWRVEHRFQLHYFTGLKTQVQAAVLSIGQTLFVSLTEVHCLSKILIDIFYTLDTRFGRKIRAKTARSRRDEAKRVPAVEQAILSK